MIKNGIEIEGQVIRTVESYGKAAGVHCQIIDWDGSVLHSFPPHGDRPKAAGRFGAAGAGPMAGVCAKVSSLVGGPGVCANAHKYGFYQSERFGGRYIFFCPAGLVHWVSPFTLDDGERYAVLAGPVMVGEPDDSFMGDLLARNFGYGGRLPGRTADEIQSLMGDLPNLSPDRVNAMSFTLMVLTSHITGDHFSGSINRCDSAESKTNMANVVSYFKASAKQKDDGGYVYPIEKERELLPLISIGDKKGSQRILNEIFGSIFFSTGGNFEVIKARVQELMVLLSRATADGSADPGYVFGSDGGYMAQIGRFQTIDELTYWLSSMMERFTDCIFNLEGVKHIDVIYKAVNYVKNNYMNRMTLEDVASVVFLSPSYFSRIFKD
ncbi:MAG: PocR ligand-binding domain-containing protein, partial [Oscillospiraceae bacterium]|nr:PocR ligand-binding domain-containing protein [Oscillospiraceae bacterium]